jgi:hypothetical protein
LWENCQDDDDKSADNLPLDINRQKLSGGVIQSDWGGNYFVADFQHFPCDALSNGQLGPNFSFPDALPDAAYATQAISRTSPNKPYVDIGQNIAEFGEIVSMVREWGTDLIAAGLGSTRLYWTSAQRFSNRADQGHALLRDIGKGNLQYQFGILPVLSDLSNMQNFRDQVDRRIKVIERLRDSPKGYRKTVDLAHLEASDGYLVTWQSQDVFMQSVCSRLSAQNIRGHCRWIPDIDFSSIPRAELERMAISAVGGLTIDFATVWELIPWSWLIDYGTNVGKFIMNQRNLIPSFLESVVLIKHSVSRIEIPKIRIDQHEMSKGAAIFERKQRYPVNADLTAYFPFLSGKQMGILSSLAVTRR